MSSKMVPVMSCGTCQYTTDQPMSAASAVLSRVSWRFVPDVSS